MIDTLPKNNKIYQFLKEKLPNSFIYVNGKIENKKIIGNNFIHSLSDTKNNKIKKINYPFHVSDVYVFTSINN